MRWGEERRNNRTGDRRSRAEKKRAWLLSGYEEEARVERRAAWLLSAAYFISLFHESHCCLSCNETCSQKPACLHFAISGTNIAPPFQFLQKCRFLCLGKWLYTLKAGQKHSISLYQYISVLFRVSGIQKPGLDDRWKRGGWGIRFFTDVQPRNRTETDTEMLSDLLDSSRQFQDLAMEISCVPYSLWIYN